VPKAISEKLLELLEITADKQNNSVIWDKIFNIESCG
jgi:hypothetical protein